jgi:hypothetical protein
VTPGPATAPDVASALDWLRLPEWDAFDLEDAVDPSICSVHGHPLVSIPSWPEARRWARPAVERVVEHAPTSFERASLLRAMACSVPGDRALRLLMVIMECVSREHDGLCAVAALGVLRDRVLLNPRCRPLLADEVAGRAALRVALEEMSGLDGDRAVAVIGPLVGGFRRLSKMVPLATPETLGVPPEALTAAEWANLDGPARGYQVTAVRDGAGSEVGLLRLPGPLLVGGPAGRVRRFLYRRFGILPAGAGASA